MTMWKGKLKDALPLILEHHYTRRRCADPMHTFLWGERIDVPLVTAVYTSPVNRNFGKGSIELSRLVRVPEVTVPLSSLVAESLRWLKRETELLFVLSYAEQAAGHHGGIYQALNFKYVGTTKGSTMWKHRDTGKVVSGRSFDQSTDKYKMGYERMKTGPKYTYIYPLNEKWKKLCGRFKWQDLPYPKPDKEAA